MALVGRGGGGPPVSQGGTVGVLLSMQEFSSAPLR